ncbi:hypothetical protein AVEN_267861-1 [Araneus ventricosus]|uniref:Uncharacterized protein n=1 Tax=Araneus ventricosus TaxID=182803 RepID=A0A4Y2SKP7_ARAVE|nr:hypothetical protein AVEN_267861-1 [Araneus ventricosus]
MPSIVKICSNANLAPIPEKIDLFKMKKHSSSFWHSKSHGGLVVDSGIETGRGCRLKTQYPLKIHPSHMELLCAKSHMWVRRPPAGVVSMLGDGVSSSRCHLDIISLGSVSNNLCCFKRRDFKITKLH